MTTREGRHVQADRRASAGRRVTTRDHAGDRPEGQMAGVSRRFPPRPAPDGDWPVTSQRRGHVLARLFAAPFTAGRDELQSSRRIGLTKLLHWLEEQPGRTWQDRWIASGADARRQPGLAGLGRSLAPQHRLGQHEPPDRLHRAGPRGAPADLR